MILQKIRLSWFRGAAEEATLETRGKSLVVYGDNGAGKSSFVDGFEYALRDGRISHLGHEYSGRRQEKGVLNTHRPSGSEASVELVFDGNVQHKTVIDDKGDHEVVSADAAVHEWDYASTVLRQDEVSHFIHATKGEKYSVLLPLLGLQDLEFAAENLRQLSKQVRSEAGVTDARRRSQMARAELVRLLGSEGREAVLVELERLCSKYDVTWRGDSQALASCNELHAAIQSSLAETSGKHREYVVLRSLSEMMLADRVRLVREAHAEMAQFADESMAERTAILDSVEAMTRDCESGQQVDCPACGRSIVSDNLLDHLDQERSRLAHAISAQEARVSRIAELCDDVADIRSRLSDPALDSWKKGGGGASAEMARRFFGGLSLDARRQDGREDFLSACIENLLPVVAAASDEVRKAPKEAGELTADGMMVKAMVAVLQAWQVEPDLESIERTIGYIDALELSVRQRIKQRAKEVVAEISSDVQMMWEILRPGIPIADIHLYVPEEVDKAIDIGLRYHGKDQPSPRLTLSEGNRNSLGLCIFLAMARREPCEERPLFLDDVVVSLDRGHRGMVAELLGTVFEDRQIVLLTHDRDWFVDLRQQLDGGSWEFRELRPYKNPEYGINFIGSSSPMAEARELLVDRPDAAANDCRKHMDMNLAGIAERLRVRLPYKRGVRNDQRGAHEFLERIVSDGKKCFEEKQADKHALATDRVERLQEAATLLVTWGNRGSHTFDVVVQEATKLMDACEAAIEAFGCPACKARVWKADVAGNCLQCTCGDLRWVYRRL